MSGTTAGSAAAADAFKVGTLARRTGLSVRTLHHYDEIGLLRPSMRTPSGHRLYGREDVARLQQIQSLRATGMALGEIGALLDGPGIAPARVIRLHLDRLHAQIAAQTRLVERLEGLARLLDTATPASVEELCRIIEEMQAMEKYFTPEQQAELRERAAHVGEARMQEVGEQWAEIIPAVRAHMERGTAPDDPEVQALARRWRDLVHEFTGGNPEIAKAVRTMYQQEGPALNARIPNTPTPEMFAYMSRVFAVLPGGGPG
jgi:DNA-binding transcriptional MerR regulator